MRFIRRWNETATFANSAFDIVWPQFLALAAIGVTFFGIANARFRSTIGTMA
jgi:ABC-2 type transport system permease protein